MNEQENITTETEEYEALMPEGWNEGDDIFADADTWSGTPEADAPAEEQTDDAEEVAADTVESPTPETEAVEGDNSDGDEQVPTTEPSETATANKLKFTARVDRTDVDVEVDESELPTLYQKAQVTDRVQGKLAKLNPLLDKGERLSKLLGFGSMEEMLDNAEQNFRETKAQELLQAGAPKEIVDDYLARKLSEVATTTGGTEDAPADANEAEPAPAADGGRDFAKEARELLHARPELRGKNLPEEVMQACLRENKPLLAAYAEYETRQEKAEAERLRRENNILKQNAASAARAPVKGVRGGGATDTTPEDDFIKGFNSNY